MRYGRDAAWNEAQYGRDRAANEMQYGREVQRQGLEYGQGLASDDLNYRRMVEENALREGRGLAETQRNWGMDVAADERQQARAWQEYAARIADQDRTWNQWSTLAGYGQNQQNVLGQLGASYASNINSAYAQQGNAASAGAIGQGNAQAGMWSNIGQGLSGAANSYMAYNAYTNPTTRGLTSGTLPTTWGPIARCHSRIMHRLGRPG